MEDNRKRLYSVLTIDEVKHKMKKQIDDISQIFCVSKSDATVLLTYHRWDSLKVSERLGENKDDLLTKLGLKQVVSDSNQDSSCGICSRNLFSKFFVDLIPTTNCSHKFCITCWRVYLDKNFYAMEETKTTISCPDQDCLASVGPDMVEKLTIWDKYKYERYILRSYLKENKGSMIKQCPAPRCSYIIEFHEDVNDEEYSLNVVCLCGHTFCWRCMLESHRPVTCNNASDWLSRDLKSLSKVTNESLSLSWIKTKTKTCPHCRCPAEIDGEQSSRFCWKCFQSEISHRTEPGFCVDLWEACQITMKEAKSDLQDFDKRIIKKPSILQEQDIRIVREGLMLVIQCRQVLTWSCVYDYFLADYEKSKKEYLRFLQEYATNVVNIYSESLQEETKGALLLDSFEGLFRFRYKLSTATSDIGNYFYNFIKALQDGLDDVKVRSYGSFVGPYWLCDRCSYTNTWFHKECKMCCDPISTPTRRS